MSNWRRAAATGELWPGEMAGIVVEGRRLLLVALADGVRAFEDRCPHQAVALSEGSLEGHTLTCRAHGWSYDACTGAGINPRSACLVRFSVNVMGDGVYVDLEGRPEAKDAASTHKP